MAEAAERLKEQYGGMWGECPKFPVADWRYEVGNDDTRLGYWEWVAAKVELEEAEDARVS